MKIYRLIVVLLVLLVATTHAYGVVRGYENERCKGEFAIAADVATLLYWDGKKINGKVWHFKSYIKLPNTDTCHPLTGQSISDKTIAPSAPAGIPNPIFIPAFIPRIAGDFDADANQTLLDVWQEKTDDIPYITGWVGETTRTTWSSITPAEWDTEAFPPTVTMHAEVLADRDPLRINIYVDNIRRDAAAEDISFNDLVIDVQMEEHIHALQITTLKENIKNELEQLPDDFELPNDFNFQELLQTLLIADELIMEVEAKTFIHEIIYPYVFGRPSPTKIDPKFTIPDDYYEKRLKFHQLAKKLHYGTIKQPEAIKYKELIEYFSSLPQVGSVKNPDYEKQVEPEDSEQHE